MQILVAERERRRQVVGDDDTRRAPGLVPRDDDVGAPRQRLADRLIGLAPHDHRLADGETLKVLQIRRDVPRQLAIHPDHAIGRARHHERHGRLFWTGITRL